MLVVPVPCLRDNYAYLVVDDRGRKALAIDPSEAAPIEAALRRDGLDLVGVLNTHHHWDHVGGNEALAAKYHCPVIVGFDDAAKVPSCTHPLSEETEQTLEGFRFRALHVPGHTRGAAAYVFDDAVFTGDTLFLLGCGRLFEGTAAEMFSSLRRLAALPTSTRVYCGHEYALGNLAFAESLSDPPTALRSRAESLRERRRRGEPSVPATLDEEIATNPFLRAATTEAFASLRQAKDAFRG